MTGRLQANETQALLTAALNGFGILLTPEEIIDEALSSGQLVRVLPDFTAPDYPFHLVYPADRRQTPKLREFVAACVSALS